MSGDTGNWPQTGRNWKRLAARGLAGTLVTRIPSVPMRTITWSRCVKAYMWQRRHGNGDLVTGTPQQSVLSSQQPRPWGVHLALPMFPVTPLPPTSLRSSETTKPEMYFGVCFFRFIENITHERDFIVTHPTKDLFWKLKQQRTRITLQRQVSRPVWFALTSFKYVIKLNRLVLCF